MRLALAIGVALLASAHTLAADEHSVVGIYSSFESSQESGDIVGMELHIVPDPTGYSAIVQASEGAPGYPVVVHVAVEGRSIRFEIPSPSKCGLAPGIYSGTVSADGLLLNGPGWESARLLKRGKSYWQK
jgi:hypothetical protein